MLTVGCRALELLRASRGKTHICWVKKGGYPSQNRAPIMLETGEPMGLSHHFDAESCHWRVAAFNALCRLRHYVSAVVARWG